MSARSLATVVTCSNCGKTLRGQAGVYRGFHVRKHNRPDGFVCGGYLYVDHQPKATA